MTVEKKFHKPGATEEKPLFLAATYLISERGGTQNRASAENLIEGLWLRMWLATQLSSLPYALLPSQKHLLKIYAAMNTLLLSPMGIQTSFQHHSSLFHLILTRTTF